MKWGDWCGTNESHPGTRRKSKKGRVGRGAEVAGDRSSCHALVGRGRKVFAIIQQGPNNKGGDTGTTRIVWDKTTKGWGGGEGIGGFRNKRDKKESTAPTTEGKGKGGIQEAGKR